MHPGHPAWAPTRTSWSALSLPCSLTHCSSAEMRLICDTPGRVFPASSTWPSPWSFSQPPDHVAVFLFCLFHQTGDFLRAETRADSFLWVPSAAQHRAWY